MFLLFLFIYLFNLTPIAEVGRLRRLAVVCWTTNHYHPCSNLGVGISKGCFIFDFVSFLPCAQKYVH